MLVMPRVDDGEELREEDGGFGWRFRSNDVLHRDVLHDRGGEFPPNTTRCGKRRPTA